MKNIILLTLLSAVLGNAGVFKVVTYPVRHPVTLLHQTLHVTKSILW